MKYLALLFFFASSLSSKENMPDGFEAATEFAKNMLKNIKEPKDFSTKKVFGKEVYFDGNEQLKKITDSIEGEKELTSDFLNFAKNPPLTEESVDLVETSDNYSIETCQKKGDPYSFFLDRHLEIEVNYVPDKTKSHKECLEHKEIKKLSVQYNAEAYSLHEINRLNKEQAEGKIAYYNVKTEKVNDVNYQIFSEWRHDRNSPHCTNSRTVHTVLEEGVWQEVSQKWIYSEGSDTEKAFSEQCQLINVECIDKEPRIIHGKKVVKECWKERLSFLCNYKLSKKCDVLAKKNCDLLEKKCLEKTENGCALWELKYKCFGLKKREDYLDGLDILKEENWEQEYEEDKSFGEVASVLEILSAIDEEMILSKNPDPEKMRIFSGEKKQCKKSFSKEILYDCCFANSGLATEIGLAKCSADELALHDMQRNGLTHYVGSYKKKILNTIKTDDVHVYCTFSSKIARIFQEAAREQQKIGWGTPKKPSCGGLTQQQISKVDFSKIDTSELENSYSRVLPPDYAQKVARLKNQIEEELQKENI